MQRLQRKLLWHLITILGILMENIRAMQEELSDRLGFLTLEYILSGVVSPRTCRAGSM
jgi:hypothetical protein